MHSESETTHLIDPISTTELASPVQKTRATMSLENQDRLESDVVPYGQDIASSPSFGGSEDSVPALNLSGSPSPTSRRASLSSNASIVDSVPATPISHLIESARVDRDSDDSPRYHRIHSTPYPKPRRPLQLTPHPQARVVSLPEWTRNRDPFLEAMRNLRSVSSPARFKRPPLSPPSAEESLEFPESSESAASTVSFPTLPDQYSIGRSILSEHASSLSVPREQFYTAPEGFFLTPPSFKSMTLSPVTTGPERSLPQDRPLPPIREDDSTCSVEPNSEDEVSLMLQRATLDTSSVYNRSSVSFSNTSRSSSPESVVFLSSIARISRSFLGGKKEYQPIPEVTSTEELLGDIAHDFAAHDGGDKLQEYPSTETYHERPELGSLPQHSSARNVPQEKSDANMNQGGPASSVVSSLALRDDPDWILFDPPRPIPALHGPPSLPYARCPSGAEGVVLDDQQELDGIVWGLSEKDPRSRYSDGYRRIGEPNFEQFVQATKDPRPFRKIVHEFKGAEPRITLPTSKVRPLTRTQNQRAPSTVAEKTLSPSPNSKEKHVRFADNADESNVPQQVHRTQAYDTKLTSKNSAPEPNPASNLTQILLDQVERARAIEPKSLPQAFPSASRKEVLEQLRRFGVPFRSHGLPTPPSTVSPKFVSQFPASDPFLAPARVIQDPNSRPLIIAHEPSMPKTFAQAATQDGTMTTPPKSRDSDMPIRAIDSVSGPLSNIRSIPLLKLRQRQHAGMDSWRRDERLLGETYLPAHGVKVEAVHEANETSASAARTPHPNLTPCQTGTTSVTPPTLEENAPAKANGPPSPRNRRQRRASKRTPQEANSAQSGSSSKENHQASGPKGSTNSRKSSQQTGRKKNQRTRTDSLPQRTPHT